VFPFFSGWSARDDVFFVLDFFLEISDLGLLMLNLFFFERLKGASHDNMSLPPFSFPTPPLGAAPVPGLGTAWASLRLVFLRELPTGWK